MSDGEGPLIGVGSEGKRNHGRPNIQEPSSRKLYDKSLSKRHSLKHLLHTAHMNLKPHLNQ